jgi:secondary thiamine-phosphate synthase enzyme
MATPTTTSTDHEGAVSESAVTPKSGGLETVRVITEILRLVTDKRLELYNLTERVAEILKRHDVKEGVVLLSSLHTTLALFVNEWQSALLHDIKATLDKVVSPTGEYRHNDPQYSDCDRHNAHSHLQATLLSHAVSFPVAAGKLVLGQFQAIIAAELDGPRHRDLAIQIIGR